MISQPRRLFDALDTTFTRMVVLIGALLIASQVGVFLLLQGFLLDAHARSLGQR